MRRIVPLLTCAALLQGGTLTVSHAAEGRAKSSAAHAKGPDTSRITIGPARAGNAAFVAWPAGQEAAPAVIVVHEWWGLNGQIRDVARRLSREGYVAIVPDLYHGKVAGDPERAHELLRGLEDARALASLRAAARWIRSQPQTAKSRIGVVGFCMGGALSQAFALDTAEVAAAVMFYGTPETDPQRLASLMAPLQGHFGAEDEGISVERVEALKAGLQQAGKVGEIYIYPGAGHAFMNEQQPGYRPEAARLAWVRTLDFLQKHVKGRRGSE